MKTLPRTDGRPPFEVLGLSDVEELVFRSGLETDVLSVAGISRRLGISLSEVRRIFGALEARGLMTRVPGKRSFRATPPGAGLGALVRRQQEQLDRALVEAERLNVLYRERPTSRGSAELLEVLDSPELVAQRALHLVRSAERELLTFDKPPYSLPSEENDPVIEQALARGVGVRAIYDREALEVEGGLESVRRFASLGEESRVISKAPFKLNIGDRRVALLPLSLEESGGVRGALIIHSSHLVDALALLWEILWDRAVPIGQLSGTHTSDRSPALPEMREGDDRVIDLLLAGAKSAAIARQLGVALSTVERRIKRIMSALGAETRFQAGFQLARRTQDGP